MAIRETYRSVSSSFTVRGRTFRFTGMQDATDYVVISVDAWSGWQWQRNYMWEGREEMNNPETVADKVNAIIDGVLKEMETIVGPLTDHEKAYIRTVLGYEAETVMLRRLRQANYIGSGTVDGACSDTDPEKMCPDCRKGFEEMKRKESGE